MIKSDFNFPTIHKHYVDPICEIFIDKDFDIYQKRAIEDAFRSWEISLSGKIKFLLYFDTRKPGVLKDIMETASGEYNFVWHLSQNDAGQLTNSMLEHNYAGLNVWTENYQFIVVFKESDDQIYNVMLHEIGHFIGLGHINDEVSIMNPYMNLSPGCITESDAEKACIIYKCIPRSNCNEPH